MTPMEWTIIPSTPAKGPRPTAATNRIANTTVSMPRQALPNHRNAAASHGQGPTLPAISIDIGAAIRAATSVPTVAIATVSNAR